MSYIALVPDFPVSLERLLLMNVVRTSLTLHCLAAISLLWRVSSWFVIDIVSWYTVHPR